MAIEAAARVDLGEKVAGFHVLALDIVVHIFPHHVAVASGAMLFKGAAALGITMLLASLSYRFFESPFLRLKKRFEIVKSRPV